MYETYILENTFGKKYIGQTKSLPERLLMHNDVSPEKARFHRTTYKKGPWVVIFKKEFETRSEALKFEKFLKTGKGKDWLEDARRGE